ncbi:hypothetical protein Indivirus_1_61 [Indivirus ILV1]|uniref:Uncharacterized protein n=1 Tax=Indivirus ILV1 TaxID=1977633 RepID=A0A1V0SCQ4_9VIRU|nr:hypothetical protein Indivirus_1_61 [Indivirus ILV1]
MQNIPEPRAMWNDIIRFITVAVVVHLLFYTVDDYGNFFNEQVLKLLLYSTIGFIIYHLIVIKLVNKHLFFNNIPKQEQFKKIEKPVKSILRKSITKKKNKRVSFKE